MNRKRLTATFAALAACAVACAQQDTAAARAAYQREQSLAEVPRLVQQFDLLLQNQDEIAQRLVKLEGADNTGGLRSEIDALRAEIAELRASIRREQDAMRRASRSSVLPRLLHRPPRPSSLLLRSSHVLRPRHPRRPRRSDRTMNTKSRRGRRSRTSPRVFPPLFPRSSPQTPASSRMRFVLARN